MRAEIIKQLKKFLTIPFFSLIKNYRFLVLRGIILGIPTAVAFLYFLLMPNFFLQPFYQVSIKNLIYLTSIGLVINSFCDAFFGYFGDKWSPEKVYIIGISLIGLWALISHFIFLTQNVFYIYMSIYIMSICIGIPTASVFHIILKMFPGEVRTSGVAVVLNMVNGVIVGNISLFFSYMVKTTGLVILPSLFISVMCFMAVLIISVKRFKNKFVENI